MTEERKNHTITIEQRKNAYLTGVTDVLSFDEECVVADTSSGAMVIKGKNLHINNLNLDKGELTIDGDFSGFSYEDSIAYGKTSIFGKIFK